MGTEVRPDPPRSTGRPIRVLLADDQDLVRAGFRVILGAEPDIEVVGEAGDGATAVALAADLRPDVVLMDVQMPGMDGLAATRRILRPAEAHPGREAPLDGHPGPRVVILTTFDREDYLFEALRSGASGFVLKNARPEDLVESVRVAARGDALLSPAVTRRVIQQFAAPSRAAAPAGTPWRPPGLTDRELEVLIQVARGASNAEIARKLHLGETTVKTHVSRVLAKLGLRDRTQAVVFAYEHGVVLPGG
ncbi:MAG TPA: response regulator transcription factor [Natronosporangium sp.]|nr:response regulator transcription factor [Natronosporangium sp.]